MSIREGNGRDGDGRNSDGWGGGRWREGGEDLRKQTKEQEKDGIEGD